MRRQSAGTPLRSSVPSGPRYGAGRCTASAARVAGTALSRRPPSTSAPLREHLWRWVAERLEAADHEGRAALPFSEGDLRDRRFREGGGTPTNLGRTPLGGQDSFLYGLGGVPQRLRVARAWASKPPRRASLRIPPVSPRPPLGARPLPRRTPPARWSRPGGARLPSARQSRLSRRRPSASRPIRS